MSDEVVIVGGGPGGYSAAQHLAGNGAQVALVEGHRLGGVCLNYGCIPTKTLIASTTLLDKMQRAKEYGLVNEGRVRPDMKMIMARKDTVIRNQIKGLTEAMQKKRIQLLEGWAEIRPGGKLRITSSRGGVSTQPFEKLILAPGGRPLDLPGFSPDQRRILSSDQALQLEEVPGRMLIVGGGVIACEFAFIFKRLGAKVTLVEAMDRLLPMASVDRDCSRLLQREMKKSKIEYFLNKGVKDWEKTGDGLLVRIGASPFQKDPVEKREQVLTRVVDTILVCVGRSPNTAGLGLEQAGVETDPRGWIKVDDQMRTSAQGVYAVGDVLGPDRVMLAHVAAREGEVAAGNILGQKETMDYRAVPGAIFTAPEVANVGLTEEQARDRGGDYGVQSVLMRTQGKAQAMGEISGQLKLVYDRDNRKILGVHLVGAQATELVAEATLAVEAELSLKTVARTIHAHPTLSEAMQDAAKKAEREE
ncbi:MAG: dihydrolipoyl dehydrogenase [Desulfohalobiaceae bacterium]|nr:dihydrolipoyl dehydrogenase [Desulfohalobiaceae bacterium]